MKEVTVMTTSQEYRQFLSENFKGLRLRKPLFYSWEFGLRFNLQTGETFNSSRQVLDEEGNIIPLIGDTNKDEYFQEVNKRASTIFESVFANSDKIFLVLMDYKYKMRKIKFSNYTFKQIDNLKKTEVSFSKEKRLYQPDDKFDIRNIAVIKLMAGRINHKNILKAIGNSDFTSRKPRLDNKGFLTSKEIYFINTDNNLIFHMYDDRGLDLISSNKETLRPIYKKYNNWILDYDRDRIDKQFL